MRTRVGRLLRWGGIGLTAFVVVAVVPYWFTEARWFRAVGQGDVFWKSIVAQWTTGLLGFVVLGGIVLASVEAAIRSCRREGPDSIGALFGPLKWLTRGGAAVVAVLLGIGVSSAWLEIQVALASVPVGETDPIFGRDLSFWLLELPALQTLRGAVVVAVWLAAAGGAVVYLVVGRGILPRPIGWLALRHGAVLAAVMLLLMAGGHMLDRWALVVDGHGASAGAGYTDVHVRMPVERLSAFAALAAAALCAFAAARLRLRPALLGVSIYAAVSILAGWIAPSFVQRFSVEPNELARERGYLRHAIKGTRAAYGLDDVARTRISADATPTAAAVEGARPTLDNVRLWDTQPLLATLGQLQVILGYYDFVDVDIDRYSVGGMPRQVMMSVREMSWDKLPENAHTFVNMHIKYTHGYGLVAAPVNRVTPEGLPELWVKDIPPQSDVPSLTLREPAIYYGERTEGWVLVGTTTTEFDFPSGDANRTTRYSGRGGVTLGGRLSRLAWSMRLGSTQLLLSSYVGPDTRVLFRRGIVERLQTLAPFVVFDRDAYPVVDEGRVKWVVDGYTVAATYPYSEASESGNNYLRNSVKATVDAIDGTVTLYAYDAEDPVLAAYRRVFPSLFTSMDDMPATIRDHLRYPVDLFKAQVDKLAKFHVEDPEVFYNQEDLWQVPEETSGTERRRMEPYYVTMSLPGEGGSPPEFLLMLPLVAARRDNMVAWIAARNDGEHLGELALYTLPKDRVVYGPMQIEARIDQDPEVSQLLTLWDQRGSQVLRGTLLVIPVNDGFLYVEPVYLQAERGSIPELKRVIVAVGDRIAMRETLEEALAAVLGARPAPTDRRGPVATVPAPAEAALPATSTAAPGATENAQGRALRHLEAAKAKLAAGDWQGWGAEMAEVERALRSTEPAPAAPGAAAPAAARE